MISNLDRETRYACLALILVWIAMSWLTLDVQDFWNFRYGARLVLEGRAADLHRAATVSERITWYRAPFYALLVLPFGLFSPEVSRQLWMVWQGSILCTCLIWARRRFGRDALLYGALFVPAILSMTTGQDAATMLGLTLAGYVLAERKRFIFSGALIGLAFAIKPNVFLMWPLLLLLARRFRMCLGLGIAGLATLFVCLAMSGAQGLADYVHFLNRGDLVHLNPHPERWADIWGVLLSLGIASRWPALAFCTAICMIASHRAWQNTLPDKQLFALAGSASALVAPHVYAYDLTALLVTGWIMVFDLKDRMAKLAAFAVAVSPIAGAFGAPVTALMGASVALVFHVACRGSAWAEEEGSTSVGPDAQFGAATAQR